MYKIKGLFSGTHLYILRKQAFDFLVRNAV